MGEHIDIQLPHRMKRLLLVSKKILKQFARCLTLIFALSILIRSMTEELRRF